jgi:1-acyl-sn-glycerol-3-phosphate acyltransferase
MRLLKVEYTAERGSPGGSQDPLPSPVNNSAPAAAMPPATNSRLLAFAARLWYAVLWAPCFAISQVFFRFRYYGKSNVPLAGPVLLVSNHQSNLDPVLVGMACPRQLKYMARKGLFFWPFSWWIRALGAVPIDQEGSALAGIRTTLKLLKDDQALLVFPEGSRTYDGNLQELLPGFCLLARRSGATLVPVGIDGAFHALRRNTIIPRPTRISLAFGQPISSDQFSELSDNQLVDLVMQRLSDAFQAAKACHHR